MQMFVQKSTKLNIEFCCYTQLSKMDINRKSCLSKEIMNLIIHSALMRNQKTVEDKNRVMKLGLEILNLHCLKSYDVRTWKKFCFNHKDFLFSSIWHLLCLVAFIFPANIIAVNSFNQIECYHSIPIFFFF